MLKLVVIVVLSISLSQVTAGSWSDSNWTPMEESIITRREVEPDTNTKDEEVSGRNYAVHEQIFSNETEINTVIDEILNSRREGRMIDEYNQVYADGNIDQALMQGDHTQARNIVREKLCSLGLMSCSVEEKRPFYSTIYAQGPPQPSYGGGPYGPARPMPPPPPHFNSRPPPPPSSLNSFGPPRKVGYEGLYKPNFKPSGPGPVYNGPFLETPPPSAIDGSVVPSYNKPPPGAIIYGSKPPGPIFNGNSDSPPYNFESPTIEKIHHGGPQQNNFYSQQSTASSSASNVVLANPSPIASNANGLQQHVHHHFHHVEGADAVGAKVPSVGIPVSNGQTINTDFSALAQSSTAFTPESQGPFTPSNAFAAGFNGASQGGLLTQNVDSFGIGLQKPSDGFYKPPVGPNIYGSGSSNGYQQATSDFGQSSFGQFGSPSSSYHSQNPDYFKKELNHNGVIGAASNYNGLSAGYAGQSQYQGGFDVARQQIVDCQCVPINHCPASDRIGRKEDLFLPIDPRNLGKDIDALSDEAANNITANANPEAKEKQDTAEDSKDTDNKRNKRQSDDKEQQSDENSDLTLDAEGRAYYGNRPVEKNCRINEVCCRRPFRPQQQQQLQQQQQQPQYGRCGVRNAAGITGRIKNPVYVDGDSEFGEYPWHVAILKKDPKESIYACGGTLIDGLHVITAAHCIKSQNGFDLRARLGEWDVNHDVEFFPYIERDVVSVHIHPEYYAGTLDNDLAILKLDHPVDFTKNPHISPACLPDKFADFTGARCWTTGWGKDAFGEHGKYQNILKEVDVPILSHHQCEMQLRQTRLGYSYKLNPGFVCAGGEEGKDACKGDGGGPLVCDRNGIWNVVGVVSWGIGCGQVNVPGVYIRVAHYLDWIRQISQYYK